MKDSQPARLPVRCAPSASGPAPHGDKTALENDLEGSGSGDVFDPAAATRLAALKWLFGLFAAAHMAIWTLVPFLGHPNYPTDVVEMLFCGHEWQLGYTKHPPLAGWLCEAAYVATGRSQWAVYLAAQIAVVLCFWAVWRLAREIGAPGVALLSACVLDSCYFFTYCATLLNNNLAMYPCWAWAILFLYWALQREQRRYWFAAGMALGLGLLAKYTTAILIVAMLGFLVLHPKARHVWRRAGPYLMILTTLAVFFPHLNWAINHGFPTIGYAVDRISPSGDLLPHLLSPLQFTFGQLVELFPVLVVVSFLTGWRVRLRAVEGAARFSRDFLLAMVLGPFALHLVIACVFGNPLRSSYGSQLWPFLGLLLLFCLELHRSAARWKLAWSGCAVFAAVFVVAMLAHDLVGPHFRRTASRTSFPGKLLAQDVQSLWHHRYPQPLKIIAGEWWLAGNAALYATDRPHVYPSSSPDKLDIPADYCTWLCDRDLNHWGGVILWNTSHAPDGLPAELRQRFHVAEIVELPDIRCNRQAGSPPARIVAAIIPPEPAEGDKELASPARLRPAR